MMQDYGIASLLLAFLVGLLVLVIILGVRDTEKNRKDDDRD